MTNLILIIILAFALMLIGLMGVILPLLPGAPLAWVGFFTYSWYTNFEKITLETSLIFLGLVLFSMLFDFLAPILGAKKYRASKYGIFGAFAGFFIGVSVFGPFGVLLGPVLGAFFGELYAKKEPEQAIKSALGAFLGFFIGSLFKVAIILTMMGFLIASL